MFNYIRSDLTKKEGNTVWICGPGNQISTYVIDNLKQVYLPEMYKDGKYVRTFNDNLVYLDKSTTAQEISDISKEPPFLGSHYILQGDYSDLDNKVKRRLLKLIRDKKPYVYAFVSISQYKDYIQMSKDPKEDYGDCIYHFKRDEKLLGNYMRYVIGREVSEKAVKWYMRRTATHSNFMLYLDKLKELEADITRDIVMKEIPDCRRYTLVDYFENMLTSARKTVHMKALNDCLVVYNRNTYKNILKTLEILMDLKDLSIRGYLMPANMYGDIEHLKTIHKLPESLKYENVWLLKRYLALVMKLNLAELTYIYLAFLNTHPATHNLYILTDIVYNRAETSELIRAISCKEVVLK